MRDNCNKQYNKKCECKCDVNVNLNSGEVVYIDGPGTLHIEFIDKGTLQIEYDELLQDNQCYRMKVGKDTLIVPFNSIKYIKLFNVN